MAWVLCFCVCHQGALQADHGTEHFVEVPGEVLLGELVVVCRCQRGGAREGILYLVDDRPPLPVSIDAMGAMDEDSPWGLVLPDELWIEGGLGDISVSPENVRAFVSLP